MKIKYIVLCLLLALVGCQRDEEMEIGQVSVSSERLEASYSSVAISCTFQTNVTIKNVKAYVSTAQDFSSATSYLLTEKAKNTFGANIEGLKDASTYYVRYEISNRWSSKMVDDVSEFNTIPFTTPTVQTNEVTDVTYNSAIVGGTIKENGGQEIKECGIVYSTNQNPTTADIKITNGSGLGEFMCNLTDLQDGTTYYVRAYAINTKGTSYGEEVSFTTLSLNGHEYVDLGLSVKWATCNVGTSKPEDYGDYFAWGETTTKSTYDWGTYKHCNGSSYSLTKYNNSSSCGTVDNKTQLELSDDAARANWGGVWRMPTDAELTELREQCTWTWTTQNGVNGYKVTSKGNGNSIFLPAAGYRNGSSLYYAGSYGDYWSSSLTDSPSYAWYVFFNSGNVDRYGNNRYIGRSVRPVCP
ncbi:MAG: hypothetical protein J6C57_07310 [Paludibacteraceae bacterium]|nr:hypothetical protein [Paludibacteraceae bacterium]